MATTTGVAHSGFLNTRRGRILAENLTAYLFLLPAAVLIFVFGIFPVGFAFFVSLHNWRRFPGDYEALGNYEKALGSFSYVLFFWLGVGALLYTIIIFRRMWQASHANHEGRAWLFLAAGAVNAASVVLFIRWFFMLLPVIMGIPQRLLGQEVTLQLFTGELFASFRVVAEAGNQWLASVALAVIANLLLLRTLRTSANLNYLLRASMLFVFAASAFFTLQLTVTQIDAAIGQARAAEEELPVWSQIILISLGAALLTLAYLVWQQATRQYDTWRFVAIIAATIGLMFGGYLLIAEVPRALAEADRDMMNGFSVTVMYALGTVPFQLAIGMALAYLLFQNIRGKALFRIIYFLPYITPWVATSIVFKVLFSHRPESLVNQFIGTLGIPPQKWLLEPTGVNTLIFGPQTPAWLAGPSLALISIMIFTTWTYIGYDAVVFLAGLGNIQPELYEASRIDGASRWREFRHITFPLLSPTTFFLLLIAVIGTFKAFTQIWIMRSPASGGSVDTVSVYIFEKVRATNPQLGYGSAMAFVLFGVILVLTLLQNRIVGRRVFYG